MRRANLSVLSVCVAVLVIGVTAPSVRATAIPVNISFQNANFDQDVIPSPYYEPGVAPTAWTGWANGGAAAWGEQVGSHIDTSLRDVSDPNYAVIGAYGTGVNAGNGLWQELTVGGNPLSVNPGDTISVSVYQGHRDDYMPTDTQDLQIQIWRDSAATGTLAYSADIGNVTDNHSPRWVQQTMTYITVSGDAGHNLYVMFVAANTTQICLDNVSGTYTATGLPTPEPGTLALLATGLLGLLAYAWRKRKQPSL